MSHGTLQRSIEGKTPCLGMKPVGRVFKQKVNSAMSTERGVEFGQTKEEISLQATRTDTGTPLLQSENHKQFSKAVKSDPHMDE